MRSLAASLVLSGFASLLPLEAQAARPQADPIRSVSNPKVAAALRALGDFDAETKQLRRDVRTAGKRADARVSRGEVQPTPPRSLERRIERLKRQIEAALQPLLGQLWVEVEPALQRADRLRGKLDQLDETLRAPRPARPPRQLGLAPGAPAGTGRITGRVVDAISGAPLDASVSVYDVYGHDVGYWDTSAGTYVADGLAGGTYFVTARDSSGSHINELYNDIPCDSYSCGDVTAGTPLTVLDGRTTAAINFALTPFSKITGVVLDATTEQTVPGVEVTLYDTQGGWVDWSWAGSDATYEFDGLTAGTYFAVAESDYYLDQLYSGFPCEPASTCQAVLGTPIVVSQGATRSGIDFRLQLGGSISGTVRDETTGDPLDGGWVDAHDAGGDLVAYASIGIGGHFQVFDLPPGNYFATTSASGDYLDELYDNLPCDSGCTVADGTPIPVTQGREHGGVDFILTPHGSATYGSISGTVNDAASGAPLGSVYLDAVDSLGYWQGSAHTGSAGTYRIAGLSAGSYFIYTSSSLYVDELYDNIVCDPTCSQTTGTAVTVTAGADAGGIDFHLDLGGWVTGAVTLQATGAPADAEIDLYRSDGTHAYEASTDSTGRYTLRGLVTGTYFAVASPYDDFADELYRELPCPSSCDPTSGTPIAVTTSQGTTGVDFTLQRLGQIGGRMTEATTGLPIGAFTSVDVEVHRLSGEYVTSSYGTDSTGRYLVSGLPPGTYVIKTSCDSNTVVDQLYQGKTCEPVCDVTQGTPVTVALDSIATGIDFVLRRTTFADVPTSHWAWKWVEAVYAAGITGGCATAPLRYCPDASVTRGQSAVFLLKAKEGSAYVPPAATGVFADVPATNGFAPWVEELFRRGVTGGCATNPLRFCPGTSVTRGQSAPFLLLTKEGSSYSPQACGSTPVFGDVPVTSPYCKWVEELVRRGIANGCSANPALFCPGRPVTRAQMALLLVSTFALTMP
jgi:hypothetical protein